MKTRARVSSKMDAEEDVHDPDIPNTNVKRQKVDGGKSLSVKPSVIKPGKKSGKGHSKKIEDIKLDIGETVSEKEQEQCSKKAVNDHKDVVQTSVGSRDTASATADMVKSELPQAQRNRKKVPSGKQRSNKRKSLGAIESAVFVSQVEHKTVLNMVGIKTESVEEVLANNELEKKKFCKNVSTVESVNILEPKQLALGKKFVGAHVSIAGGLWNAITATLDMGGRAFGLFLKSQRTWKSKPLESKDVTQFKKTLLESGISPWMVVPHGSYLMNCGSSDDEVLKKSRENLIDELDRCEQLGLPIYNFHPGSSKGLSSRAECIEKIAGSLNYVHSKTKSVITVIENMSGQGNTIGGTFAELKAIIDLVRDKSRVGICIDTCHAFAAGYDIKSEEGYEKMKAEFDTVIGHEYLKAIHLNDSKGELGCNLDRHENIGKGKLGLATFARIMRDPFFDDVPMILETPECDYSREIRILYDLQNKEL